MIYQGKHKHQHLDRNRFLSLSLSEENREHLDKNPMKTPGSIVSNNKKNDDCDEQMDIHETQMFSLNNWKNRTGTASNWGRSNDGSKPNERRDRNASSICDKNCDYESSNTVANFFHSCQ